MNPPKSETAPGLSDEALAAIRKRVEAAILGPWSVPGFDQAEPARHRILRLTLELTPKLAVQVTPFTNGDVPTAAFVAHARTDIPALLAEVTRLRAGAERVERIEAAARNVLRCWNEGGRVVPMMDALDALETALAPVPPGEGR